MRARFQHLECDRPDSPKTWWVGTGWAPIREHCCVHMSPACFSLHHRNIYERAALEEHEEEARRCAPRHLSAHVVSCRLVLPGESRAKGGANTTSGLDGLSGRCGGTSMKVAPGKDSTHHTLGASPCRQTATDRPPSDAVHTPLPPLLCSTFYSKCSQQVGTSLWIEELEEVHRDFVRAWEKKDRAYCLGVFSPQIKAIRHLVPPQPCLPSPWECSARGACLGSHC